jgi:hypothetical protein
MVHELIAKIHQVLNLVKDFKVGYSTKSIDDGYMLIEYKGKRYAVKAVEITNPSEDIVKDVERTQYYV